MGDVSEQLVSEKLWTSFSLTDKNICLSGDSKQ